MFDFTNGARQKLAINLNLTRAGAATLLRRSVQGPRRDGWAWRFETVVDMMHKNAATARDFSVKDLRASFDRLIALTPKPDASLAATTIAGVPAVWIGHNDIASIDSSIQVSPESDRVLLYLHGGGYVTGSPKHYQGLIAEISRV